MAPERARLDPGQRDLDGVVPGRRRFAAARGESQEHQESQPVRSHSSVLRCRHFTPASRSRWPRPDRVPGGGCKPPGSGARYGWPLGAKAIFATWCIGWDHYLAGWLPPLCRDVVSCVGGGVFFPVARKRTAIDGDAAGKLRSRTGCGGPGEPVGATRAEGRPGPRAGCIAVRGGGIGRPTTQNRRCDGRGVLGSRSPPLPSSDSESRSDGAAPSERTEVRIAYDQKAIYFGLKNVRLRAPPDSQ